MKKKTLFFISSSLCDEKSNKGERLFPRFLHLIFQTP